MNHQWSKSEEFEVAFAAVVRDALGPLPVSVLVPETSHRAVGGPALRRADPFPLDVSAAATAPSTRTRPAASTTGAGRATSAASSTSSCPRSWTRPHSTPSSPGTSRWTTRRTRALRHPPRPRAPGERPFECVGDVDECRAALLLRVRASGPDVVDPAAGAPSPRRRATHRHPTRRRCSPPRGPSHPGALCALRSPGPRSLTRRSASGAWASRDAPASAACGPWAANPCWSTTRRRRPSSTASRCWPPGRAGWSACSRCDVVVKSPGISRYRPEVAQLEEAGVAVCGGLGLWHGRGRPVTRGLHHRHQGEEHDDGTGRPPAGRLGYDARAGGNIGHPPWDPSTEQRPTTGWSRPRASRSPTSTSVPRVVAVTSLFPDHLDWHGSVERYYADKLSLCTKPGVDARAGERRRRRAARAAPPLLGPRCAGSGPTTVERDAVWAHALGTAGSHNAGNAAMARAVLEALGPRRMRRRARWPRRPRDSPGCRAAATRSAASTASSSSTTASRRTCSRRGPPSRPSPAARSPSSSAGTTAASTTRRSAGTVAERAGPTLVVTMPDNGPRIGAAVRAVAAPRGHRAARWWTPADLAEAVDTAFAWAPRAASCSCRRLRPASAVSPTTGTRRRLRRAAAAHCGRSALRRSARRPAPSPRAR